MADEGGLGVLARVVVVSQPATIASRFPLVKISQRWRIYT